MALLRPDTSERTRSASLAAIAARAAGVARVRHGHAAERQPAAVRRPGRLVGGRRRRAQNGTASLAQWWQRFDDPLLAQLIDQAMQANTSVTSAEAAVRQARALRDVAAAALLPSCPARHPRSAAARREESRQQLPRRSRCELGARHLRRESRALQRERGSTRRDRCDAGRRAGVDRRRSRARLHHAARHCRRDW